MNRTRLLCAATSLLRTDLCFGPDGARDENDDADTRSDRDTGKRGHQPGRRQQPVHGSGHVANWVQTVPGKGWNVLIRLYGPLEPWFDKSWKPGEFELVQ